MLMVQGKRNYPLPLQPHPQNQKQNQPKTYIGFGTANGGTSNPCFYPCDPRRGFGFIKVPKTEKAQLISQLSLYLVPAMTYSPTQFPMQYNRPGGA
jgi:hypothetical protein